MSILGLSQSYRRNAMGGFRSLADMEARREEVGKQLKSQERQATTSNTMTGAGLGYLAGPSVASAMGGTAAGAGAGTAAGAAAGAGSGAATGAAAGSWAGPIGMGVGALAGFLISRLF